MKQHPKGFLSLVTAAKVKIHETTVESIQKRMAAGEAHFLLIDVREDGEWSRGHLPSALHLGKGIIERDIEQRVPDLNQEMVLYCGGGFRSALAADSLQNMGYTHVWSMDGGFHRWVQNGFEIVIP